jgi:D-3-phosphoglycerate dehydrogenase
MRKLKAIVRYGTGYENIDLQQAHDRGIRIANVQGYANHAVSDHALGLMFACIRGIGAAWPGGFGKPIRPEVFELHDKTLGIIGIGRIGSHFSRKASPMFRQTLACDPYQTAEAMSASGARKSELGEVLEKSHVISIHCTLTLETHHLMDRVAFGRTDQHPVIVNTARGGIINGKALREALDAGRIHSAGMDVFENEPPGAEESALIKHPRVIATPHVAWFSDRASKELQRRAADNLLALLQGREVPDELTRADAG